MTVYKNKCLFFFFVFKGISNDRIEAEIDALENMDHERISIDLKKDQIIIEDGISKTDLEAETIGELEGRV